MDRVAYHRGLLFASSFLAPMLAAALVGIPIVATAAADQYVTVRKYLDESSDE